MRRKKRPAGQFVSVVLAAGGKGTRMGADINKIFLELAGEPVIAHTLRAFDTCMEVDEIIIATSEDDMLGCRDIVAEFGFRKVKTITQGGPDRTQSVLNGLREVSSQASIVLVHDAARPLIRSEEICQVTAAASETGAAVLGVPSKNTLKQIDEDGMIVTTLDRNRVWEAQTPQGFRTELLRSALEEAVRAGCGATDDAALVERSGAPVTMVKGRYDNLKITTYEDLLTAESILLGETEPPLVSRS